MIDAQSAVAGVLIPKGEFARRRGVTPGRVSQWIKEEKIFGPALVGEGRHAKIVEEIAVAQLRQQLDVSQMTGNGLGTRLDVDNQAIETDSSQQLSDLSFFTDPHVSPAGATIEDRIKHEKLEALKRANRAKAIEEAERAGRFVDANDAAIEMRRIAAQLMSVFEGGLPDIAAAIAANWQLPQRDVLHLMRSEFRAVRAAAATALQKTGQTMPQTCETMIEGDDAQGVNVNELQPKC